MPGHPQATHGDSPSRRHRGRRLSLAAACLTCLTCLAALTASAAEPPRVSALTPLDEQFMLRQRALIDELTRRWYGSPCCDSVSDLDLLQRLLDDQHVGADQRLELQAMGVHLGDLLAEELGMHWVVYEDDRGRSRALRLGESENYLFPVTMISRRREAGDLLPVAAIYADAVAAVTPLLPPLPYQ